MAEFTPRTFSEIFGEMFATMVANSPITDANIGSIVTTLLEAAAQEDDEQYFQMRNLILQYSLDTTSGTDLDTRAFEYGLTRKAASKASTIVTVGDSAITKISTGIFSGVVGPSIGDTVVEGDVSTGFPASGSIVVGRDTPNVETIVYNSITQNTNSVTFNLDAGFANNHGTDETIVFAQGGNRIINSGTVVKTLSSDISPEINFALDDQATILDGESELTNVAVTAVLVGTTGNVPIGFIIEYDSLPFATATVTNLSRVTNGRDIETDQGLRDRIRNTIQSLSRGTAKSILSGLVGTVSSDDNKRIVSASIVEPNKVPDIVKIYIDDGTGFIPSYSNVGVETVVGSATGGEQFVEADNVPIVKAFVESTSTENYDLSGTETLIVEVGGIAETVTFESTDFDTPGDATAREIRDRLRTAQSFDARLSSTGTKVRIFSRSNTNDDIEVTGGTSNTILNFPTDKKVTARLYKEDTDEVLTLLDKDGITAELESVAEDYTFTEVDGITAHNLAVVVDGKNNTVQNIWLQSTDLTAELVVVAINSQAQGFFATEASNGTTVKLVSRTEKSSDSKLHVIDNFDEVWYGSGTLTNGTDEFAIASSDVTIFASDSDYVYVGRFNEKFNSIYVKLAGDASAGVGVTLEYWNGAWTAIGFSDTTDDFQQDGFILFHAPEDWIQSVVDAIETDSSVTYFVRLQRNNASGITAPIEDVIKVSSANEQLGFALSVVTPFASIEEVGIDNDYTLNRFVGQIELTTPLVAGDILTFGSIKTRAILTSISTETYDLASSEVLNITIDGVAQTYTFVSGDFGTPSAATAEEVVIAINTNFSGITASTDVAGNKVNIQINKWDGTFRVTGGTANDEFEFAITEQTSMVSHIGFIESGNIGPFFFNADDFVTTIIDGSIVETFLTPLYKESTLTGAASTTSVTDTTLQTVFPNDSDLIGLSFEMTDGDEVGQRRQIVNYVPGTGVLTLESRTWVLVGGADGTDAYILLSYDGVNYKERVNPKNFALNGLTYGKVWVAVGEDDGTDAYIITSPNGNTWTESVNPQGIALNGVVYNSVSRYVAVGDNGAPSTSAYIIYSDDDGETWTISTNPKDFDLYAIIHDGTTYVAVGAADGTDPYMATSTDGITWTERGPAADNFDLYDITHNGTTLYVAVGEGDGTDPMIYTAVDPTSTWTKRTPTVSKDIDLNGVAYDGSGLYVAVGGIDGSGPYILSSTNGTTWTERNVTNEKAFALNSVWHDQDNSIWYAAGDADGTDSYVVSSTDGTTWTEVDIASGKNFAMNANRRDFTALSGTPSATETYQVLPSTVEEVVTFWNNRKVTNITDKAEVRDSSAGTKVQIATDTPGGDGSVNITGGTANDEMAFSIVEPVSVSSYQHWNGLMQLAQYIVDGREDDQENFPGFRAAGVQVDILEPVSREISIVADVTTNEGVTLSSLIDEVKSEISAYINGLGVGDDVIVSEIICAIKEVVGVFDVDVTTPSANIAIADDELARVSSTNINIL